MTATPPARLLKTGALLALLALFALAAHYGSTGHGNLDFSTFVGTAPFLLMAAMALRQVRLPVALLGSALLLGLLTWLWPQLRQNVALLYYVQHLGAHLALGLLFGRSLLGPGEPLVTQFARILFPQGISARNARYTRQVTLAWTCFFFGNALLSTLLFWLAPPTLWSIHANLLTGPLVALMFLVEHFWRMTALPPEERPSIAMVIRAYREGRRKTGPLQHP